MAVISVQSLVHTSIRLPSGFVINGANVEMGITDDVDAGEFNEWIRTTALADLIFEVKNEKPVETAVEILADEDTAPSSVEPTETEN